MIRKISGFFFAFLFCFSGLAGQAVFCLNLQYHNTLQDSVKEAKCTTTQMLIREDLRSFFECKFSDGSEETLSTAANVLGYDNGKNQQYSGHLFSSDSSLGRMIFSRFGFLDIVDAHVLKIYYGNKRPRSTEHGMMFKDRNGRFFRIEVNSLEYGACQK